MTEALPQWLSGKEPTCSTEDTGDTGLIPGGQHGNSLQYSCQENPMNRGAWWARVHGVVNTWT